jgi:DNA repair protein RecO (recombination protein O)
MPRRVRLATQRLQSDALLVRRLAYGEADDIVHLFTEETGAVSVIARGSRRNSKRFTALEPMHTLRVGVDLSPARELGTLKEATLTCARIKLTTSLAAMTAAGQALRWVRRAAPDRTPEPALWVEIIALLDALEAGDGDAQQLLAASGLRMLAAAGWGLELLRCLRCGKTCPHNARTIVDVSAGGVVCRNCGGVGTVVSSKQRAAMIVASAGGAFEADPRHVFPLIEQALEVHGRGGGT